MPIVRSPATRNLTSAEAAGGRKRAEMNASGHLMRVQRPVDHRRNAGTLSIGVGGSPAHTQQQDAFAERRGRAVPHVPLAKSHLTNANGFLTSADAKFSMSKPVGKHTFPQARNQESPAAPPPVHRKPAAQKPPDGHVELFPKRGLRCPLSATERSRSPFARDEGNAPTPGVRSTTPRGLRHIGVKTHDVIGLGGLPLAPPHHVERAAHRDPNRMSPAPTQRRERSTSPFSRWAHTPTDTGTSLFGSRASGGHAVEAAAAATERSAPRRRASASVRDQSPTHLGVFNDSPSRPSRALGVGRASPVGPRAASPAGIRTASPMRPGGPTTTRSNVGNYPNILSWD